MDLPKGFHREVIEAKESSDTVDFTKPSIKNTVAISPLKSGGSNFKTNILKCVSSSKLVYKSSIGGFIFSFIFLVVGIGIMAFGVVPMFRDIEFGSIVSVFPIIFGLIFASAGVYMLYIMTMPRVFDKQLGLYYKSHRVALTNSKNAKNHIALSSIIAIQIIGEHVTSDSSSYGSFELNLVLDNGTRQNVVDHGNLKSIIDDAHVISDFLNIPIWHAESNKT